MNKLRTIVASVALLSCAGIASAQPSAPAPAPDPGTPAHEPAPSGPGVGIPQKPPAASPVPAPVPVNTKPVVLTPAEADELKQIETDYENFLKSADDHDKRMRSIARREFDGRTSELERRYAERIAKTETDRAKRHTDTIALLEKFLKNHPKHEQFTPDAMFRLADLYLDLADTEVEDKLAAQEKEGAAAVDSAAIVADYSRSLNLWEAILKQFPSFRQTPSTMYLLAYYGKTKDERKSLQVFLALACSNQFKWDGKPAPLPTRQEAIKNAEAKQLRDPYSDCKAYPGAELELVRHAWVRGIADYQFTIPGELDSAIAAYLKVANGGNDSRLYAESLYKLAWSYYKRDYLKQSIDNFDKSVRLYDETIAAGGQPPLELRDESIQYIAVAFTDPWEGETDTDPSKAFQRARDFYKGRENEKHVRDVWVALGHAFEDLQAWDQAVDSYRIALGPPWELNPNNPIVHQQIVNAFESKGDKYAADQAAAELATKYAPGTAWYAANEKDREAMDTQHRIAERALYAAARNTHSAATTLRKDYDASSKKDPQAKADYLAMYAKAVDLYRTFITTYPESDYIYEFSFLEGEALYYSERYAEAIDQYKWVRDHRDLGVAYYIEAARSITQTYEKLAQQEVDAGRLQPLKVPTVAELQATPQPWQPQPIPDIYLKLQAEYDNYQNVVNDPQAAPGQGINAALISLAYFHVDDAISRFQKVMDNFCHTAPADPRDPKSIAPAAKAKDGILAIYQAQNNFDAIQATNNKFISATCGDKASVDLAISQNRSLNFSRAADLYKKTEYIPAAEAFYRFYKTAPAADPDLPVALYNAAVSYKLGERPKTAIALFKEFAGHPEKNFRESPYYLDALRLQAASQQAAFQFDEAVKTYLDLYDTTKKAKKLGIKAPDPLPGQKAMTLDQIGLDAVYNAAFAAELNRDFKKSIDLWGQYGRIETDRKKQDRALYEVANLYKQQGDVNSMSETLDRWRAKYGKDAGNEDDYVKSFADTAELQRKKGRTAQAKQLEKQTIEAWKKFGSTPNTKGAKLAGAYELATAEEYYEK
ncbi:MAG: Tetratricopeptide repeat protein, partial [Myxococcales bacterium]|nr:Tetratricopeptide repeat protein [Myxococcales bacterium]